MQPVRGSLHHTFETLPTANLGILDRLPLELTSIVLRNLDIQSFFRFRQVNRQARVLSSELWEYKLVSEHGLEGLRGVLRGVLAHRFTIEYLYRPLVTDICSICGSFGGHLFLFTAERCCLHCLQYSTHYRVLAISSFAKLSSASLTRLRRLKGVSLPMLRIVPGVYNWSGKPARRPNHLLFEEGTIQTLLSSRIITEDKVLKLRSRRELPD